MDSIDATGTDPAPGLADEAAPERNRDDALRDAAIELLAEIGYDRLTMDAVAARARASKATIYRRWQNKAELVVDAVGCLKGVTPLPDSGSLAGDLREVCDAFGDDDSRLGAHVMLGLDHGARARRGAARGLHRSAWSGLQRRAPARASSSARCAAARSPRAATSTRSARPSRRSCSSE